MEPQWPLILFTFFLCLAGGIFGMQGYLDVKGKGAKMQKASLLMSLIALIVGGISVFFHLQHWERIFNGFGHITSGITHEFIICIVFAVVLLIYFIMMHRSEDNLAPKWCGVLAIIVGLLMPIVTGFSYLMPARPSWDTPLLVLYYTANTFVLGSLTAMIIADVKKEDDVKDELGKWALWSVIVELIIVFIYACVINASGNLYSSDIQYYFDPTLPDVPMVDRVGIETSLFAGSQAVSFWLGTIAVGHVVPLVLLFMLKKKNEKYRGYSVVAFICAVIGSFTWRVSLYVVALDIFSLFIP